MPRIMVEYNDERFRQRMNELERSLPEVQDRIVQDALQFTFDKYREQIPVAKPTPSRSTVGAMRDSVFITKTRDGGIVGVGDPNAKYVLNGVRPHMIVSSGEPLRFWWERVGGWVKAWSVNHPGQKRNPFHARVVRLVNLEIPKIVDKVLNETVRRI